MTEGWISLYRKFLEWEWYDDNNMVKLFIHLLLKANHSKQEWRGIIINRGQVLTGLDSLSFQTKISKQTLRTCLKRLEDTQEINTQVTNKYRIITLCKYDSYQDAKKAINNQTNNQLTFNQHSTNNQLTANNNVNNNNNEKNENKTQGEIDFSEKDKLFLNFLCDKFKIKEMTQPRDYISIVNAINFMNNEPEEINRHFRDQCFYYFKYKKLAEEKKHGSVSSFLFDTEISPYRDSLMSGGWNKSNWKELGENLNKSDYYPDGITPEDVLNAY